jgi:hypothetical protein
MPTTACFGERVRPVSGSTTVVAGLPASWNNAVKNSFTWAAAIEFRPFDEPLQFCANHARVGPDIALGMPPGVLLTGSHRACPWLSFSPGESWALLALEMEDQVFNFAPFS